MNRTYRPTLEALEHRCTPTAAPQPFAVEHAEAIQYGHYHYVIGTTDHFEWAGNFLTYELGVVDAPPAGAVVAAQAKTGMPLQGTDHHPLAGQALTDLGLLKVFVPDFVAPPSGTMPPADPNLQPHIIRRCR